MNFLYCLALLCSLLRASRPPKTRNSEVATIVNAERKLPPYEYLFMYTASLYLSVCYYSGYDPEEMMFESAIYRIRAGNVLSNFAHTINPLMLLSFIHYCRSGYNMRHPVNITNFWLLTIAALFYYKWILFYDDPLQVHHFKWLLVSSRYLVILLPFLSWICFLLCK